MNTQTTMKTLTKKYELHLEAAITIGELDPETDIQYLIGVLEAIQMPETSTLAGDVVGAD